MSSHQDDHPWWAGGLYFSCLGCGRCCRGEPGAVWVTEAEQKAIALSLGIDSDAFNRRYMWRRYGRPSLRERSNYDCIFLERQPDRCSIYGVRPKQCSSFPFWPEILKSKLAWDRYSLSCPGMDKGNFHDYSSIIERLR